LLIIQQSDGLADNVVNPIAIDANGNKWFGIANDLSKFSEKNTTIGTIQFKNAHGISSNVNIYPNSSSNAINFEGVTSGRTLQLLTMDRHLLKSVICTGNPIDISSLENGIYFVKISNSITTETKKLIKQ
jgi:ligand-binding sensor domain-containing protein